MQYGIMKLILHCFIQPLVAWLVPWHYYFNQWWRMLLRLHAELWLTEWRNEDNFIIMSWWCNMVLWNLFFVVSFNSWLHGWCPGGRFKNTYELLNQRALKFSYVNKIHIFQCMGKIFCVEFQRYPLKFHTKYLTHTLKDMIFMQFWNFKSS